jgi:alkanesulfonate monooxygenase SsuD/methylene tetrahydromethanopterin reductase-like flavin-dependent oxidoreductase (luciferase family)
MHMDLSIALELHEGMPFETAMEFGREADRLRLRGVFAAEHLGSMSGRPEAEALDPWLTLAALATTTADVRLGTMVTPVTFRPPTLNAKLAATLDVISGGRAELGLGLGWSKAEHRAYGLVFPPRAERLKMLEEHLQILDMCWKGEPFTFDGRHLRVHELLFSPAVRQPSGIPVVVGGMTGSVDLAPLAVRLAAGYALGKATPAQAATSRSRLDRLCAAARRDPLMVPLSVVTRFCVVAVPRDVERVYQTLAHDVRPASSGIDTWLFGDVTAVRDQISAYREAGVAQLIVACEHPIHLRMLDLVVAAAA